MKKMSHWTIFLVIVLLVSACSPPPPAPIQEETLPPQPTDTPVAVAEPVSVSFDEVMNKTWNWIKVNSNQLAAPIVLPDPRNYTLTFLPGGELRVKADCNQVTGTYTVDGSDLTISTLGPSTMMACPEGSMDKEFLEVLNKVSSFGMQENQLELLSTENSRIMTFASLEQASTTAPKVCAGINFDSVNLEAQELPYTWQKNCIPDTPYDRSTPPTPSGLPEHIEINFIPAGAQEAQPEDPVIYLIPVDAYRELWGENGDQAVSTALVQLRSLLKEKPSPIPTSGLPVLPYEEVGGVNDLAVQGKYLEEDSFVGLRFVGRFSQGPNPVTNEGMMYIYQGGTYGAEYLITFFYPVSTGELPNSAADVSAEEMQKVDSDPTAYLLEMETKLNALKPEDWEPDLTVLDAVITSLQFEKVSLEESVSGTPELTGYLWRWIALVENQSDNPEMIPDPYHYTVNFNPLGRFEVVADCNWGNGPYVVEGDKLTMTFETTTAVVCDRQSLSDQFITLLGQVESFSLDGLELRLEANGGTATMLFTSLGPLVTLPEVTGEVPTAIALEPLSIRSGPGTDYPSFGTVALGTTAEVVGVSEDGGWWVIKVPADVAPDEHGWVNANYVDVTGTENVPVIPTP